LFRHSNRGRNETFISSVDGAAPPGGPAMNAPSPLEQPPRSKGVGRWIFIGFALIAGYFLLMEHRAHVVQYLPLLLVLACPLMHLFHRHGGHGGHRPNEPEAKDKGTEA
jgi:hypothetical protein